jgi:hypothetical protein
MAADGFEFVGYVESINIKGVGPNSHQFLFSLVTKNGANHWSFLLDPFSEPPRYAAMAGLLSACFAGDKIVRLNTTPNTGGGPAYAAEIEVVREGATKKK